MENYELERTPLYYHRRGGASPDGIEVSPIVLEEGTTAPEMMLLPYMSEPATGSRMPSMSTGECYEGDDEADSCCQQS